MYMTLGMRLSVYLLPVWLLVMAVAYQFKKRQVSKQENLEVSETTA